MELLARLMPCVCVVVMQRELSKSSTRLYSSLKLHSHRIRHLAALHGAVWCFASFSRNTTDQEPMAQCGSFTWTNLHMTLEMVCMFSSDILGFIEKSNGSNDIRKYRWNLSPSNRSRWGSRSPNEWRDGLFNIMHPKSRFPCNSFFVFFGFNKREMATNSSTRITYVIVNHLCICTYLANYNWFLTLFVNLWRRPTAAALCYNSYHHNWIYSVSITKYNTMPACITKVWLAIR